MGKGLNFAPMRFVEIWNFLWDNQVAIAFVLVLAVWIVVRGGDLIRWIIRKLRKKPSLSEEQAEGSEEDPA